MKTTFLKSMSLVAFLAASTPTFAADPVVATVDGKSFTYSQVMETKASLPKQYQSIPDDKLFPELVNQAVDTYLINKTAQASGEAQNPEVKKAIEKATEGIISQAYLLNKVKGTISDAAIQAKYEELIKNFPKEKEVHLRHILVNSESTAKAVIKALEGGADFKKLAKEKSSDAPTAKDGGDLDWVRKSELPTELAEAAFALAPGAYSRTPIKTDFGWHVIKVEGFKDAKPPKFDEVKNELKSLMTQEAILGIVKDLRAHAKIALFDKDGKPLPPEAAKKPEEAAPDVNAPAAPTEAPKTEKATPAETPAKK